MELRDEVAAKERSHAELQHSEALKATGLQLHSNIQGVSIRIADPARFASAMREVEHPDDASAEKNLASQTQAIIDEALDRAAKAIVMQYADEARLICGGTPPMGEAFIEANEGIRASSEDVALADKLPDHAAVIAKGFGRIDGHPATVEGAKQLALAHQGKLVVEWGVARHIGILGNSDSTMGVDRLTTEKEWDAVCNYLRHLQNTAPQQPFTTNAREAVLRDINTALDKLPAMLAVPEEDLVHYHGDYGFYDEPEDTYGIPEEELEGDSTIPNLRAARDRVKDIFGL